MSKELLDRIIEAIQSVREAGGSKYVITEYGKIRISDHPRFFYGFAEATHGHPDYTFIVSKNNKELLSDFELMAEGINEEIEGTFWLKPGQNQERLADVISDIVSTGKTKSIENVITLNESTALINKTVLPAELPKWKLDILMRDELREQAITNRIALERERLALFKRADEAAAKVYRETVQAGKGKLAGQIAANSERARVIKENLPVTARPGYVYRGIEQAELAAPIPTEPVTGVVEIKHEVVPDWPDAADIAGVGKPAIGELLPQAREVVGKLESLMLETGMTREQIRRAVATGYGRFNPDTYAKLASEADSRLANLFQAMTERSRGLIAPVDTQEDATKLRHLIQDFAPVDTGALRDSFDDPRTVVVQPDGNVMIDFSLPYARIQDLGGTIHRTSSTGKSYTIRISAQHYVQKAVTAYNASRDAETVPLQVVSEGGIGIGIGSLIARGMAFVRSVNPAGAT